MVFLLPSLNLILQHSIFSAIYDQALLNAYSAKENFMWRHICFCFMLVPDSVQVVDILAPQCVSLTPLRSSAVECHKLRRNGGTSNAGDSSHHEENDDENNENDDHDAFERLIIAIVDSWLSILLLY